MAYQVEAPHQFDSGFGFIIIFKLQIQCKLITIHVTEFFVIGRISWVKNQERIKKFKIFPGVPLL